MFLAGLEVSGEALRISASLNSSLAVSVPFWSTTVVFPTVPDQSTLAMETPF
jgi:hypothetical protein